MIGALPRADVRSANGQAHIEYTFGVNGTVRHKNNTFIMGVAYRPNDHIQFWDSLQASYNEVLAAGYDNIIITGDLNADP